MTTPGAILALAGAVGSGGGGGATGPTGPTGATGPTGPTGAGGAVSTDPFNIITRGTDGGLFASLEGGSEQASVSTGQTYVQQSPVAQQFYTIILEPNAPPLASLNLHIIDPWASEDVVAPFIFVVVSGAVTTFTMSGTNVVSLLPLTVTVPTGGAGYLFQWNTAVIGSKWVRIL